MHVSRILTFIVVLCSSLVLSFSTFATKIGYSGRLVQTDGTPVTGSPNLQFDLYYSNDLVTSLATNTVTSVPLSNGIYTVELDFPTIGALSKATPPGASLVIQVRDTTNGLTFDTQAILATPIASYALTADAIADGAITPQSLDFVTSCADNQVLIKNGAQFDCINQAAALAIDSTLVNNAGTIGQATVGTAGTYTSVTVDAYGRVTSGSSPAPVVGSSEITNDSIMDADINSAAAISWSKINAPTIDKTYVGLSNVANVAQIPASDLDNSGTLDSTTQVPSELAVKGYVDTYATNAADAKVINSMAGTETTQAPSVDSVKNYVLAQVGAINESQWTTAGSDIYYSTGNVGIGTAVPKALMSIYGTAQSVNFTAGGSHNATIHLHNESSALGSGSEILFSSRYSSINSFASASIATEREVGTTTSTAYANTSLLFRTSKYPDINSEKVRITSQGRVGIGTTAPGYKLHVNGSVAGVGAYNALSDRRYKKNFVEISDSHTSALEKITSLHGYYFDWRQDEFPDMEFMEGRDMGVIAQEVEKVFPEAVVTDEVTGYKSVAYSKLVAPLIEAVKELAGNDDKQSRDIASLKEENQMLKDYICSKDPEAPFCAK